MSTVFDLAFSSVIIPYEGTTLDMTSTDKGNWTGGVVGKGELRGSRYGISAAVYPAFDFLNGTIDDAKAIYRPDYWNKIRGDELSPITAMTLFDAAVQCGVTEAITFLQSSLATRGYYTGRIDGDFGPLTMSAMVHGSDMEGAQYLHQQRAHYMIHIATWGTFRDGWENRLVSLPFKVMQAARTI